MSNGIRINIYGGPCTGKSTLAAYIFAKLKEEGETIELVTEFVKMWAYQNRLPQSFDQIYIFAKQLHTEDSFLSRGVSAVITDSPILLTAIYSKIYSGDEELSNTLENLALQVDKKYDTYNIYIKRSNEYDESGRYQTLEEAIDIDSEILEILKKNYSEDRIILLNSVEERDSAVNIVRDILIKKKNQNSESSII